MPNKTLIALATAWGPQHGGINSFNTDFLKAFGVAYLGTDLPWDLYCAMNWRIC